MAAAETRPRPVRRRARLARGPVTIGDAALPIDPQLTASDPYRPDTVADGGDAFGLTVRAASVRGASKRYTGGPRQDDLCLGLHPPTRTAIVAVADGVSAAPRSDLAAALAARQATAAVARQLDRGGPDVDWGEVFHQAAWALVAEHRRAVGDDRASVEEAATSLATTLTVAAVSAAEPDRVRVRVAAVGDSPAFLLADHRFEALAGDSEDAEGLVGGGVRALPRDADTVGAGLCALDPGRVLLICSDGLALPLADGTGDVGQALARELARPPDIVDFARLLDFSRATYDDDRTLIAVWPARPM